VRHAVPHFNSATFRARSVTPQPERRKTTPSHPIAGEFARAHSKRGWRRLARRLLRPSPRRYGVGQGLPSPQIVSGQINASQLTAAVSAIASGSQQTDESMNERNGCDPRMTRWRAGPSAIIGSA
jgi:hypothetical protein